MNEDVSARGRCHTGDHRAPDTGGSCDCGTVTIVPVRRPDDAVIEALTVAANGRRLAWFTDAELRAELDRRAEVAGPKVIAQRCGCRTGSIYVHSHGCARYTQTPTNAGAAPITAAETAPASAGHGIAGPDAQPQVSPSRTHHGEDGERGASDAPAALPVTDPWRQALVGAVEVALDAAYGYSSYRWPQQQDCQRIADALMGTVRHLAAEELRAAADAYESDAEQPRINHLADHVYRPGDCLSSLWLRHRAAALDTPDHGKA